MTVEIEPGPTKRGVPMGTMRSRKRARASWNELRFSSSWATNRSMKRVVPWIMVSPVLNRRMPPAIWKAWMEIPKNWRSGSPMRSTAQRAMTTKMLMTAAIDRWTLDLVCSLIARKIGMMLKGLSTAKIAANAVRANWN